MKKTIFYILLVCTTLTAIAATAQEDIAGAVNKNEIGACHSYIGIIGGITIPAGNFAKGDYIDNNSGYAGTGGNIGITGVYFIGHSRFGIAALALYQAFSFKGAQSLSNGYKDGYSLDSTTLYTKGNNYALSILAGPYYSISIARHFSIDVRAIAGYTSVHRAGYQVAFEDAEYDITQQEATASALGWQAGIAPRYNFSRHWAIMLNANYFSSYPNFNVTYTSFHPASNAEGPGVSNQPINKTLPQSYHQLIQGVNTNLSLVWRL